MLAIVGPTAAGKSALALEVAGSLEAEIVSIDSTQIYRGMDIGTDKVSIERRAEVAHHLIDEVEPDQTVTVKQFRDRARQAIAEIASRGKQPLLVGGSGLYFRAVVDPLRFPGTDPEVRADIEAVADEEGAEAMYRRLEELDPEAASRIQPENARRIVRALEVIELTGRRFSEFRTGWDEYDAIYDLRALGLTKPREELDRRIDERVDRQIEQGLVDEVKGLVDRGMGRSVTSGQALGYAQILRFLDGQVTLDEAIDEIKRRTRRFARRQLSWFRADPRIEWRSDDQEAAAWLQAAARKGLVK